jgi:hypothetical protein
MPALCTESAFVITSFYNFMISQSIKERKSFLLDIIFPEETYKEAYTLLFNEVTEAIERLKDAQLKAEEIFLKTAEKDTE